jgi:hypothetical protein
MDQNEFEYNLNHPYFEDLTPENKRHFALKAL